MSLPADCVYGADNVVAAYLPAGMHFYGGYYNGPYANVAAIQRRFPGHPVVSIAVHGPAGSARSADFEPGTWSSSQYGSYADAVAFLSAYKGSVKPILYTMGSWANGLVNYLASHGHPRSSYYLWTAHYAGLHICGLGCGLLPASDPADGTQYATGHNDYDVFRGYVLTGKAGAVAPTIDNVNTNGLKLGDTDANTHGQVHGVQNQLNKWAKYCGFPVLIADGDFGGKTYNAVRLFQQKRNVGLTVDGVVGPATEKYLANPPGVVKKVVAAPKPAPKPVVPSGNPELKLGMVTKQVAAMQYYLSHSGIVGVRGIDADGDFGQQTETSLKNFQKAKKLTVDGVYGPATAKALAKVAVG